MPLLQDSHLARVASNPHARTGAWAMLLAALLCLTPIALSSCSSSSGHPKIARYSSAPEAQKITVNLLRLDYQVRTQGAPLPTAAAAIGIGTVGNGVPLEIFTTTINPEVVKQLNLPGVWVRHISTPYRRVSVVIEDLALLFPLARIREVRMIAPAYGATTNTTTQDGPNIESLGGNRRAS